MITNTTAHTHTCHALPHAQLLDVNGSTAAAKVVAKFWFHVEVLVYFLSFNLKGDARGDLSQASPSPAPFSAFASASGFRRSVGAFGSDRGFVKKG